MKSPGGEAFGGPRSMRSLRLRATCGWANLSFPTLGSVYCVRRYIAFAGPRKLPAGFARPLRRAPSCSSSSTVTLLANVVFPPNYIGFDLRQVVCAPCPRHHWVPVARWRREATAASPTTGPRGDIGFIVNSSAWSAFTAHQIKSKLARSRWPCRRS
jgi:hypothetical protein